MVCKYCSYEGWEGDRCPQCGAEAEEAPLAFSAPMGESSPADPGEPVKAEAPGQGDAKPVIPPPFIQAGTPRFAPPPAFVPPQQGGYPGVPQYVLFHEGNTLAPYNPWTVPRSAYRPYGHAHQGVIPGGVPMVAPYRPGVPQYAYYMPAPKKKLSGGKIALIAAGALIGTVLLLYAVGMMAEGVFSNALPWLDSPCVQVTWQTPGTPGR